MAGRCGLRERVGQAGRAASHVTEGACYGWAEGCMWAGQARERGAVRGFRSPLFWMLGPAGAARALSESLLTRPIFWKSLNLLTPTLGVSPVPIFRILSATELPNGLA